MDLVRFGIYRTGVSYQTPNPFGSEADYGFESVVQINATAPEFWINSETTTGIAPRLNIDVCATNEEESDADISI